MTSASDMPDALAALAADPSGAALGLTLPPGRLVVPGRDGGPAVYWLSDAAPAPGAWARLRAGHRRSGLWPLLLAGLADDDRRPWRCGEVCPDAMSDPATMDPDRVLAQWWTGSTGADADDPAAESADLVELRELTAPYAHWPGLAQPGAPAGDADRCAGAVADDLLSDAPRNGLYGVRLGLVPAARGSDALAVCGWQGPANLDNDTGKIAAVVRSWEERFAVRVVAVGFDLLFLSVAAPPTTPEHALRVAAEHFAFCPDNVWQGAGDLRAYAEQVASTNIWVFWWD